MDNIIKCEDCGCKINNVDSVNIEVRINKKFTKAKNICVECALKDITDSIPEKIKANIKNTFEEVV